MARMALRHDRRFALLRLRRWSRQQASVNPRLTCLAEFGPMRMFACGLTRRTVEGVAQWFSIGGDADDRNGKEVDRMSTK
jgi:hypothetical protein